MSTYHRVDPDMFRCIAIAKMGAKEFRAKFEAAISGETNEFTPFIKGPYTRPLAHEWAVIRAEVFERDNYTCGYCGARGVALECDHIVPVAKGGTHELENLKTACKPCNRSKAAKSLEDWKP